MNAAPRGLFDRLRHYFIGHLLVQTSDYYEQAKIRLVYNLSMALTCILAPICLVLYYYGLFVNIAVICVALLGLLGVLFTLKRFSAYVFAAKLYVVIGMGALMFTFLVPQDTLVITSEIWFVVVILFTFFTLGRNWALGTTFISALVLAYFAKTDLVANLRNEHVYENGKIDAFLFIIPIEFYALFYIINQFLKTRNYAEKELKQTNKELNEKNVLIERQRNEKSVMIREIHHRVKNNLQIVNSLLRLQSNEVTDEKVLELFEESQNRVVTMALLHENLYKTDELKRIDISEHLRLLATDLIKTYSVGKKIELNLNVDKIEFGSKTMVPLGLIINEIITNSLKYAFPKMNEGKILLDLKSLGDNRFELLIGDDGVGISQLHNSDGEKHFGTELVDLFIDQLDGEMELLPVKGTKYRILFSGND